MKTQDAGRKIQEIGIILNGVTGRMGRNQHLTRSLLAIRNQRGLPVGSDDALRLMPVPLLVGRNPERLAALAAESGGLNWTTELDTALADPKNLIYFDAQTTAMRVPAVQRAIAAGKHIYCEKPTAETTAAAYALYQSARRRGIKHGVVQDKLWLPGLRKLKRLIDTDYFGTILSVRGEFGYWVFCGGLPSEGGDDQTPQRPSWNYRQEDGGGIIVDMLCHWRYVLDNLFGSVKSVSCLGATHLPTRWDEQGRPYRSTAEDAAYATIQLENGVIAQFNSSWCVRVYRDDLLSIQVDGTRGSAVAGLRDCRIQPMALTPRATWNPDVADPIDYRSGWSSVPANTVMENAFKAQWERFLCHVAGDEPFPWDLREAAKGVQFAECAMESWKTRRWVDIPDLPAGEEIP